MRTSNNIIGVSSVNEVKPYEQQIIDDAVETVIVNWLKHSKGINSLKEMIPANSKIVIKPNLVNDNNMLVNSNMTEEERRNLNDCFTTNKAVIISLLKLFKGISGLDIAIIEAPIQFCDIEKIVTKEFLDELNNAYSEGQIRFVDLRRTIYYKTEKEPIVKTSLRNESFYIDFDLAEKSEHERSQKNIDNFRVTDYPPNEMKKFHSRKKHVYRIAKELFEADFIFSIPKLKTHMKAGMTGAMKNFIGVIGNKECLPHHTKGCPAHGGDCYGDNSFSKRLVENILDKANQYMVSDPKKYWKIRRWARLILKIRWILCMDNDVGGSWYGNDTIWRTIEDINRIVLYGKSDGTISDHKQRQIFSLVDAVVAGQEEGPMSPTPYYLNKVIFCDYAASADIVAATLMGFDYRKVKYLDLEMLQEMLPLIPNEDMSVLLDGKMYTLDGLACQITKAAIPAERWKGHLERTDLTLIEPFCYKYSLSVGHIIRRIKSLLK